MEFGPDSLCLVEVECRSDRLRRIIYSHSGKRDSVERVGCFGGRERDLSRKEYRLSLLR